MGKTFGSSIWGFVKFCCRNSKNALLPSINFRLDIDGPAPP